MSKIDDAGPLRECRFGVFAERRRAGQNRPDGRQIVIVNKRMLGEENDEGRD